MTLVIDMPVTKLDTLDTLDTIAFVADGGIEGAGTVHPRVWLSASAWAEVEIPRFADPPPVAIDVYSTVSHDAARGEAERLAAALARVGWTARLDSAR